MVHDCWDPSRRLLILRWKMPKKKGIEHQQPSPFWVAPNCHPNTPNAIYGGLGLFIGISFSQGVVIGWSVLCFVGQEHPEECWSAWQSHWHPRGRLGFFFDGNMGFPTQDGQWFPVGWGLNIPMKQGFPRFLYVPSKWLDGGFWSIFYFYHYLGKWSNLTKIFQPGWNHQLGLLKGLLLTTIPDPPWLWLKRDWFR